MKHVRALVIDDSRVMRNMVMQTLRKTELAEFHFTEAEDGMDALAKFNPAKIDICFVDWNMPKMAGIDFVRKVRASKQNDAIPLIMVTSEKAMGKLMEALDNAGANAYICKPFTVEKLQQELAKHIEGISTEKPAPSGGFFSRLVGKG